MRHEGVFEGGRGAKGVFEGGWELKECLRAVGA